MKKTQKMLLGMCSGAAALGAAVGISCLAVNLANKKSPAKQGDFDISFDAGEGSFVSNKNTQIRANDGVRFDTLPKPVVQQPGKVFAGWRDATSSSSEILKGNQIINSDMKLVATYNNASSEFATVKFVAGIDETQKKEVILLGNPVVSVMKNYYFLMVNRPSASWEVKGVTKYFKGWKYAEDVGTHSKGEYIKESDAITTNITLYPEFTTSVTMNWHVDTNQTGSIDRGSTYTTLEEGTAFNEFNQPGISCTSATASYYFEGWYKSYDATTQTFGEKWNKTDTVEKDPDTGSYNRNAYAKWVIQPAPSSDYVTMSYVKNETATEVGEQTFYPSKFGVIKKGSYWKDVSKPNVKTGNADYKLNEVEEDAWEYRYTDTEAWKPLTSDIEMSYDMYIRPVFQQAILSVSTVLPNEGKVSQESEQTLTASVVGGQTKTVTWQLFGDSEGKTSLSADVAIIDSESGKLTVKAINPDSELQTTFWVQATSTADTSIKSTIDKITIDMPYQDNQDIWFYYTKAGSNEGHWYSMTMDALCSETTVTAKALKNGVDPLTVKPADSFANTLHFGTDLLAIKSNFLSNWTGFNAKIDLGNSNVTHIFSNFLAGCTSFNQQLDLTKIKYIGNGFLYGCTSYNYPITFESSTNGKPVLYEIGDDFLGCCSKFNSTITLPESLLNINNDFLFNCTSFNQDLTLPHSLEYVGSFFMSQCDAFTSTLNVNFNTGIGTTKEVFACNESDLASINQKADISATGFSIAGDQAEDFKEYYKTQQQYEYAYRRIKGSSWDGKLPDYDTLKASLAKFGKATSWTADYNYCEGKEIVNIIYNGDSGHKAKIVANDRKTTETEYEASADNQNGLLDEMDENGNIKQVKSTDSSRVYEIKDTADNIIKLMTSGDEPTFVPVTGGVGYYTADVQGGTCNIYFDEKYNLSRAVLVSEGFNYIDLQFSNIDSTEVTVPTVKNKITLTWDSTNKKFVANSAITAGTKYVFLAKLTNVDATTLASFKGKFQILNSTTPIELGDYTYTDIYNVDGESQEIYAAYREKNTIYVNAVEEGEYTWTNNDLLVFQVTPSSTVANATINLDSTHSDSFIWSYNTVYIDDASTLSEGDSIQYTQFGDTGTIEYGGSEYANISGYLKLGHDQTATFSHSWDGGCYINPENSTIHITDASGTAQSLSFSSALQSGWITWTNAATKGSTGSVTINASAIPVGTQSCYMNIYFSKTEQPITQHTFTVEFEDTTTEGKFKGLYVRNPDGTKKQVSTATSLTQYGKTEFVFEFVLDSTATKICTIDTNLTKVTVNDGTETEYTWYDFAQLEWTQDKLGVSNATEASDWTGEISLHLGDEWNNHNITKIHIVFKDLA